MLLGHIAVELPSEYGARVTVMNIFQQRLFHPVSNLDSFLVTELGRIAARTRVSQHPGVRAGLISPPPPPGSANIGPAESPDEHLPGVLLRQAF